MGSVVEEAFQSGYLTILVKVFFVVGFVIGGTASSSGRGFFGIAVTISATASARRDTLRLTTSTSRVALRKGRLNVGKGLLGSAEIAGGERFAEGVYLLA